MLDQKKVDAWKEKYRMDNNQWTAAAAVLAGALLLFGFGYFIMQLRMV